MNRLLLSAIISSVLLTGGCCGLKHCGGPCYEKTSVILLVKKPDAEWTTDQAQVDFTRDAQARDFKVFLAGNENGLFAALDSVDCEVLRELGATPAETVQENFSGTPRPDEMMGSYKRAYNLLLIAYGRNGAPAFSSINQPDQRPDR